MLSQLVKGDQSFIKQDIKPNHSLKQSELNRSDYDAKRNRMLKQDRAYHFTVDVPELTDDEHLVNRKLKEMRDELVQEDHSPMLLDFFEGKKVVQDSNLHKFFQKMPKGGHLHVHIEATISMEDFMNFTRADFVYYNMEENKLKTAPKGVKEPGYQKCNTLRKTWNREGTFDGYLVNKLLLQPEEIASRESRKIWDGFQYKFMLNDGVIHYHKFYKAGLLAYYQQAVKEGISIVEVRHASGIIFGDDQEFLSYKDEFELYQSVIDEIRKDNPDFELRVIVVAFKALGKEHVNEQLRSYQFAMDNGYDFVTGFDLVNEEESTEPIYSFVDDMLDAMKGYPDFSFYFHAGESANRHNENLYDAILLGTKRIGHGINIALHPHLMQIVRERNIGYEICPISNFILGYTLDMRWHPARILMANGIAVTISSDDPTFWNYQGLALDFTYAAVAWQLDLKDVKQLAINSIKQSSIKDHQKEHLLSKFFKDWQRFIASYASSLREGSQSIA